MLPFPIAANAAELQANITFVNVHPGQLWTFYLQANTTFNLTAQQELTAGTLVQIVGQGNSVITPVPGIRAFKVNAGALAEFVTLTISGGKITAASTFYSGGAALWVAGGSATLIGVSVTNNTVSANTTAESFPSGGGILVDANANLTVVNSHIDDNQVLGGATYDGSASGGGLYVAEGAGVINISDSTISNNKVVAGASGDEQGGDAASGGMTIYGGTVLLSNVTFDGNIAQAGNTTRTVGGTALGGAISIVGGWVATAPPTVKLVGLTVTNNKAIGGNSSTGVGGIAEGGGLFNFRTTTTVLNSSFISNTALGGNGATNGGDARGGAVAHGAYGDGKLSLLNSTLGQNTAQGGNGTTGTQGSGFGGGLSSATKNSLIDPISSGPIPQLFNNTIAFNQAVNGIGTSAPGGGGGIWSPITGATNIASALNNLVQGNKTTGVGPDVNAAGVSITVLPGGGPNIIGDSILQIAPTLTTVNGLPIYPLLPDAKTGTTSVVGAIANAENTTIAKATDEVGNARTTGGGGLQINLGAVQFIKGLVTVTVAPVASITRSSLPQSVAVSATVTSPDGTVINEGIVTFTLFNRSNVQVGASAQANVRGGVTTPVSLTVPGNTPDGTYTIQAVYSDATNNFVAASPSTTTLTIFPWT
jgi:hypothetical protein